MRRLLFALILSVVPIAAYAQQRAPLPPIDVMPCTEGQMTDPHWDAVCALVDDHLAGVRPGSYLRPETVQLLRLTPLVVRLAERWLGVRVTDLLDAPGPDGFALGEVADAFGISERDLREVIAALGRPRRQ